MRKWQYILITGIVDPLGLDPVSVILHDAKDSHDAFRRAADYLGIDGEMTPELFRAKGGMEIKCCSEEVIFP